MMICRANPELRIEQDPLGNIYFMSPTSGYTGNLNSELNAEIVFWNRKEKAGFVFDSSTGFTLPNKAMRSPDISWVSKERWENLDKKEHKRFPGICPEFVVEIRSSAYDKLSDLRNKMEEWIENGVKLAWLIDPANMHLEIFRPNTDPEVEKIHEDTVLSGEEILNGLEIKIHEFL